MKLVKATLLALSATMIFSACKEDDVDVVDENEVTGGTFAVEFEPLIDGQALKLSELTDTVTYNYMTTSGQEYNVSEFSFYVSAFTLSGPNGESYSDELEVSAADAKGYYRVIAGDNSTYSFLLENIPKGTYDNITFTLGVAEEGVESGASGGVLDVNNAPFWGWNAGYVAVLLEGLSSSSPQVAGEFVNRTKAKYQTAIHMGGWKDVTDSEIFVNNLKTVSLDFGETLLISETLDPSIHINTDVSKVYNDSDIDFSINYSIHSPKAGAPFADPAVKMFVVDHVHQ